MTVVQPCSPRPHPILAAGVAALTATTVLAPSVAKAGAHDSLNSHCVVEVIGEEESGAFVTAEPVCFETLAEALSTAGLAIDPGARVTFEQVRAENLLATATASGTIGIHYDGSNRTGASITVTGADCSGGYLNLTSDWTNRISSTLNGCPVVRFFDGFDKSGANETTTTQVNLGALNNAANSIQYASS